MCISQNAISVNDTNAGFVSTMQYYARYAVTLADLKGEEFQQ